MDPAVAAAVFPVVFLAELPDKTTFASLAMSTKAKPASVWAGAAVALALHTAIAVTVGAALLATVPHGLLYWVLAATFVAAAALTLWRMHTSRAGASSSRSGRWHLDRPGRAFPAALAVVFVAEWGDLTQILTADLAAHYHAPVAVGIGAVLALWAVAALAVTGGRNLLRLVRAEMLRLATAAVLTAMAGLSIWQAVR